MAGKIVADTLEHSTAGSIATNFVVEGSAKVWCNWDSTQTARDSLNISTVADTAQGRATLSFSSNMNNNDYAISGHQRQGTGDTLLKGNYGLNEATDTISTSQLLIRHAATSASTFTTAYDADYNSTILHGDLA